jgi:hypothetical protein
MKRHPEVGVFSWLRQIEFEPVGDSLSWHYHWFGAVNEAKKSTKYFSERMNEGGFSRYPVAGAKPD